VWTVSRKIVSPETRQTRTFIKSGETKRKMIYEETEYDALQRLGVCLKFPVRAVMTVALAVSALSPRGQLP
jgi:hypothetical protein